MRYTFQQGTAEWHQARLGRITSTAAAALMTKARKAGEVSATAKTEIYRILAERNLRKEYRGAKFQEYLDRNAISSKAIEYGKATEDEARDFYSVNTGYEVQQLGFITPDDEELEPFWGDSPDGVIFDQDHKLVGCIEIKCPKSATFMEYKDAFTPRTEFADSFSAAETLKAVESKYYWQVCNHLAVSGADWCDFIVYDPMLRNGYICRRINREDVASDIEALTQTIKHTIQTIINSEL